MTVILGDSICLPIVSINMRPQTDDITDKSEKPFDVNPLTKDEVREALSLAVDRRTIANAILEGFAKLAN